MKRKTEIRSMFQKHYKRIKISGDGHYDHVVFWDLEWVWDGLPDICNHLDEKGRPPFGMFIDRTHIIDCGFISHDGSLCEHSHICAYVDPMLETKFTREHKFHEIVKNAKDYPHMDSFWNELTSKLKGDVLFLSFAGNKQPIDFLVLKNCLGGHLGSHFSRFRFKDARQLIAKRTNRKIYEHISLAKLHRDVCGRPINDAHHAISDAKALKRIFEKLDLISGLLKSP